jgi:CBS domain-containing protein
MNRDVVTLAVDDALDIAKDIMTLGRIRHLPVVGAGGRLVGIVTQRDLLKASLSSVLSLSARAERDWLAKVRVGDVMSSPVVTIGPDVPVSEAVETMLVRKFGCLPVVDDGTLVGLVTETDCLRHLDDLLRAA